MMQEDVSYIALVPQGKSWGGIDHAAGNVIKERAYAKTYTGTTFSVNELNDVLGKESARDEVTKYEYDVAGRLLGKTDALKQSTTYSYDNNNNVTNKTDANKAEWTYIYDESNQLIETISPKTTICRYEGRQLIEELRSVRTLNEYDSFGNIIKVVRDADGIKQTIGYSYDTRNQKIAVLYPDAKVNAAGKNVSNERYEDNRTLKERFVYNAFGELIESTDKAGNSRHWVYDGSGRMAFMLDANKVLTQYSYDEFDNVLSKTLYSNPLVLGQAITAQKKFYLLALLVMMISSRILSIR